MHKYAIDEDKTPALFVTIALLSIVCAYALAQILKVMGLSDYLWFVDIPAVPGFMFFFYKLFDLLIWKSKFARSVGLSSAPDLSGVWEGEIRTSHDKFTKGIPATLTVTQTSSHISLNLSTNESHSESCLAMIFAKTSEKVISYAYRNAPSNTATPTMHTHDGTAKLILRSDGVVLEGDYYTGRDRANHGTLKFTKS